MTQHRDIDYGERLPEALLDALQELLGSFASPNFAVTLLNSTTVQVVAGAGDDQVSLAIDGRWRWRVTSVNAAHPGGAAGTHDVYVTASDNSFAPGSPETDNTVYTFGLEIRTSGTPSSALHRKVARVAWSGSAITSITPLLGAGSLASTDLTDSALLARLASPALSGTPTAPTAAPGTNTTQLATTAFVAAAVAALAAATTPVTAVRLASGGDGATYAITAPAAGTYIVEWGGGGLFLDSQGDNAYIDNDTTVGASRFADVGGSGGTALVPGVALGAGQVITFTIHGTSGAGVVDAWAKLTRTA